MLGVATESVQKQMVQDQPAEKSTEFQAGQRNGSLARRVVITMVSLVLGLGIALWGVHSLQASDPYVQGVLQLTGDVERGHEIFQLNCATCHGLEAAGEVGPDLHAVSERKSRVALIHQVTSGQTPPMPQFQPNKKDMADLLSFLETL